MATRRNTRRAHSRSRRRRSGNGQVQKLAILAAMGVATLGGGGAAVIHLASQERMDASYCYARTDQHQTAIFLDASFTNTSSDQQQRDYQIALIRAYEESPPNTRISIFTTTRNVSGSLLEPAFSICRPAASPEEQERIGAPSDTPQRLALRAEQAAADYRAGAAAVLENARDDSLSARNSPILASLQAISRSPYFSGDYRTLWAITDGLENSPTARFGAVAGDAPPFEMFAQQDRYDDVRPRSLRGADVRLLLVETATLPQPGLEHITSAELRQWYRDYFEANGAASVELTTIRFGAQ